MKGDAEGEQVLHLECVCVCGCCWLVLLFTHEHRSVVGANMQNKTGTEK